MIALWVFSLAAVLSLGSFMCGVSFQQFRDQQAQARREKGAHR